MAKRTPFTCLSRACKRSVAVAVLLVTGIATGFAAPQLALAQKWQGRSIHVFAGSVIKPPLEELARSFEQATGARVYLSLGGSGALLSQLELARHGDIYLPGSSDFMEKAKRFGVVDTATEVRLAYLIPAINVAKGNPHNIHTLKDLARSELRVGIARPDAVCVGLYAVENLVSQELDAVVRPNIVNFAESCQKTAQMLSLGLVDAVLGWAVFSQWEPEKIETIPLALEEVSRIGYIPAALTAFSEEREIAQGFLAHLTTQQARAVMEKHGYLVDLEEARIHTTPETPVGGEFSLPHGWE